MAQYDDCPKELRDFLFYMLTIRGRSPRTVNAYYLDLRTFLRYLVHVKTSLGAGLAFEEQPFHLITAEHLRNVTLSDVYEFLNYTLIDRNNMAKTRSRKVSSIRAFFKYLNITAGLLEDNPVKNLEMPSAKKSIPKYLTLEESLELLNHIPGDYYERDYCIIVLLLNCGMRLSELVGINLKDIRDNSLKLLGKGNKERIVYLNDACQYAIAQYLAVREPPVNLKHKDALFVSKRGTRLSGRRVQQIVEAGLEGAGLGNKGYSPHKLRHTAATLMYQHGHVDIRVLKEVLGHANLATTEIYTHVANAQVENAANQSPLAKVKVPKQTNAKKENPNE